MPFIQVRILVPEPEPIFESSLVAVDKVHEWVYITCHPIGTFGLGGFGVVNSLVDGDESGNRASLSRRARGCIGQFVPRSSSGQDAGLSRR